VSGRCASETESITKGSTPLLKTKPGGGNSITIRGLKSAPPCTDTAALSRSGAASLRREKAKDVRPRRTPTTSICNISSKSISASADTRTCANKLKLEYRGESTGRKGPPDPCCPKPKPRQCSTHLHTQDGRKHRRGRRGPCRASRWVPTNHRPRRRHRRRAQSPSGGATPPAARGN